MRLLRRFAFGCRSIKIAAMCAQGYQLVNETTKVLVGEFPQEALAEFSWFQPAYDAVSLIDILGADALATTEFVAVVGTWCGDTRESLPVFLKLLAQAGIPRDRIKLFGLGRDKKLEGVTERYSIEKVPTFIVFEAGREIGRIVETPRLSMAADLLAILRPGERGLQDTYAPRSICFGCGPANASGLRISSIVQGDEVVADWKPELHHEAFPGMLNGGIIGSLLDCHANWTAAWHLMRFSGADSPPCTVTAEYSVKLLRPTPTEAPVRLVARVAESATKERPDRAVIEASLSSGGKVCATCRGTFVAVKPGHPAYHRW